MIKIIIDKKEFKKNLMAGITGSALAIVGLFGFGKIKEKLNKEDEVEDDDDFEDDEMEDEE